MKGMTGLVIVDGWSPYSSSTVNLARQCASCPKQAREMNGWWWKWEELPSRHSISICGDCFSKIRRKFEGTPRCERCHSAQLIYDRVGVSQTPRVTCEICAWHKEGVQIPGRDEVDSLQYRLVGTESHTLRRLP